MDIIKIRKAKVEITVPGIQRPAPPSKIGTFAHTRTLLSSATGISSGYIVKQFKKNKDISFYVYTGAQTSISIGRWNTDFTNITWSSYNIAISGSVDIKKLDCNDDDSKIGFVNTNNVLAIYNLSAGYIPSLHSSLTIASGSLSLCFLSNNKIAVSYSDHFDIYDFDNGFLSLVKSTQTPSAVKNINANENKIIVVGLNIIVGYEYDSALNINEVYRSTEAGNFYGISFAGDYIFIININASASMNHKILKIENNVLAEIKYSQIGFSNEGTKYESNPIVNINNGFITFIVSMPFYGGTFNIKTNEIISLNTHQLAPGLASQSPLQFVNNGYYLSAAGYSTGTPGAAYRYRYNIFNGVTMLTYDNNIYQINSAGRL